jgi:hypothetical protein
MQRWRLPYRTLADAQPLIGNISACRDVSASFNADNLYRLDHSTLGGVTNLQMAYDAMADIV